MSPHRPEPPDPFHHLRRFVHENAAIDFATIDLDQAESAAQFCWAGLQEYREEILRQLRPYQRLVRIVQPVHSDIVFNLLGSRILSALQIAAMPRQRFITTYLQALGNDRPLIEATYTGYRHKLRFFKVNSRNIL
jgi:hypothetical protein